MIPERHVKLIECRDDMHIYGVEQGDRCKHIICSFAFRLSRHMHYVMDESLQQWLLKSRGTSTLRNTSEDLAIVLDKEGTSVFLL